MRRRAGRLEKEAIQLRALADEISVFVPQNSAEQIFTPQLTNLAADAAAYIRQKPGQTGDEIAQAIDCSAASFRQNISAKLKAHGFTCKTWGGGGWYPPQENLTRVT